MNDEQRCRACGAEVLGGALLCDSCKQGALQPEQAPILIAPSTSYWVLGYIAVAFGVAGWMFSIGALGSSSGRLMFGLVCYAFGFLTTLMSFASGWMLKPRRLGLPGFAALVNLLPVMLVIILLVALPEQHR